MQLKLRVSFSLFIAALTMASVSAQEAPKVAPKDAAPDSLSPEKISAALAHLSPSERMKAEALVEAANSCGTDCTLSGVMLKARSIYDEKMAAQQAAPATDSKPGEKKASVVSNDQSIFYHASAGAVAQTTNGAGASVGLGVDVKHKGLTYSAAASGQLGSTAGVGAVPAGEVKLQVSGELPGKLDLAKKLDPLDLLNLKRRWILGLDLDRNLMIGRGWRVAGQAGVEYLYGDKNQGNSLSVTPMAEAGVGNSGHHTVPFVTVGAEAAGVFCPFISKDKKDEFCLDANARLMAGLLQAEGDLGGGVMWRHKLADNDSSKWIHSVNVGAGGSGSVLFDWDGAHAGAMGGLSVSIH